MLAERVSARSGRGVALCAARRATYDAASHQVGAHDDRSSPRRRADRVRAAAASTCCPTCSRPRCLFSGFYAIVAAIDGNFDRAGIAIFVAMVFDGLDGRIARWTNTRATSARSTTASSDMVAFGLAPAIVAYQWGVARIAEYGYVWGRLGWLATFFYAACAALRLARFNSRVGTADKRYLRGPAEPVGRGACSPASSGCSNDCSARACAALVLAFVVAPVAGAPDGQPLPLPERQGLRPEPRVPFAFICCWCRSAFVAGRARARRECCSALFGVYALSGAAAVGLAQARAAAPRAGARRR